VTSEGLLRLDEDECRALLRTQTLGRVACMHGNVMLVLPVYYAMLDRDVVFRTAPGAKLDAAILNLRVAFEVDHAAEGWSVLVTGRAEELREQRHIDDARAALGDSWAPDSRERLVRIHTDRLTGRRIAHPRKAER
jgi:nitroimidazol reductase NimA-like FMN-containing flavoprotein (pyridoxamine 5'-phosphate oxidase superfamily)